MAVGAARRRGPWPGYRTRRGRAGYARESFVEGSGRVRPPAGRRRGTGRGGRAGCASADRGAPRRPELGRLGRIPGPGEEPCASAGRRLPRGERHQERDRRGGRPASPTRGAWRSTSHWLASWPPNCFTAGAPLMLFRAPRRASCSRTPRACPTTSRTRRSPRGCVRSRAAPGARPSWWTMRPRTERRTSLPARASSTPTPATWSPGSWWSR